MSIILLSFTWFALASLVSIDYIQRLHDKYNEDHLLWRPILGFIFLTIFAPIIGLARVLTTMLEAICGDDNNTINKGGFA